MRKVTGGGRDSLIRWTRQRCTRRPRGISIASRGWMVALIRSCTEPTKARTLEVGPLLTKRVRALPPTQVQSMWPTPRSASSVTQRSSRAACRGSAAPATVADNEAAAMQIASTRRVLIGVWRRPETTPVGRSAQLFFFASRVTLTRLPGTLTL
jgi:hypothetical protein